MSDLNIPGSSSDAPSIDANLDDARLIDVNVSFGTWPFQSFSIKTVADLRTHLNGNGIRHALTSHLGGVFNPDPATFNLSLIDQAETDGTIRPVPVVNPVFPGWQRHLDECRSRATIRAIKIYPTFHNYRLVDAEFVQPLVEYIRQHDLTLLIAMRLEDERNRYFALNIVGLPVDDVVAFNQTYQNIRVICLNAYLPEIRRIGKDTNGVGIDTSFAEWFLAMEETVAAISPSLVYFGSHTPFLYTKANVLKLKQSGVAPDVKAGVGSGNAAALLGTAN